MVVRATALQAGYRKHQVLESVELEVRAGEIVSVVGANGVGKTTLLACMAGLHRPTSGTVTVAGRDVSIIPRRELATILAFVPQASPTRFPMSVFDAVMLGRRPYLGWAPTSRDLEVVADAIERLGLETLALRRVDQLSGGERQKVTIARAVAQEPKILVLDEPTTYLDLQHQIAVLDILRELAGEGVAIIMSIHDVNLSFRVSHRIVAMESGSIVADAPPPDITAEVIERIYGVSCEIATVHGHRVVVPQGPVPSVSEQPDLLAR